MTTSGALIRKYDRNYFDVIVKIIDFSMGTIQMLMFPTYLASSYSIVQIMEI